MKLYIVRHGESESNEAMVHQGPDSVLSQKGIEQTKALAERVAKIDDIDLVICSPYVRTRQTLDEIIKLKNHEVIFSDLAIEVVRPSILLGQGWESTQTKEIKALMQENKDDHDWHHSDEENFHDFKIRITKLLRYIETFGDKNILLVTHGLLAKMMVGIMLFGENLTGKEHESIERFLHTNNTGITLCDKGSRGWKLITWNDYAHLG